MCGAGDICSGIMGISPKVLNNWRRKKIKTRVEKWKKLKENVTDNNVEPLPHKQLKTEKPEPFVIPKFDEISFTSKATERMYGTYTLKFLKKLFIKKKITLRKVKQIRWKQILKFFKDFDRNKQGSKNMRYALQAYFTHLEIFNKKDFDKLKIKGRKPFEKEMWTKEELEKLFEILTQKPKL